MTIDEFLKQYAVLQRRADDLLKKYNRLEEEAENPGRINNFNTPSGQTNINYAEEKIIKAISAGEEWKSAKEEYQNYCNILERAMYKLFYWEGLIINQAYITNIYFRHNQLSGLSDILKTKDRAEILAKLETAKEHLKRILNENGIKID